MKRNIFVSLITLVYALLLAAGQYHHELWADEANCFLVGKDSHSISELLDNCRYEGHPLLWNFLIYFVTRFTHNPVSMQVLNMVLAVVNVFLILRYAPFPRYIQVLLVFGYFSLFEYGVISRNYMLVFVLLTAYLAMTFNRNNRYWLQLIVLLLLAHTHLFGLVIAVCLFIIDFPYRRLSAPGIAAKLIPFVFIAALVFSILRINPAADDIRMTAYNNAPLISAERFKKVAGVPVKAFLHIPNLANPNPWNRSTIIVSYPRLALVLGLLLIIIPGILFRKSLKLLVLFYGALLGIVLSAFVSPLMVAPRHASFLFLALLACWWRSYHDPHIPDFTRRLTGLIYAPIFILQLACGLLMYREDWQRPFSNGKQVAEFIKQHNPQQLPVAMSNQGSGQPISVYLDQSLFYPEKQGMGSFSAMNTTPFLQPVDSAFARTLRWAKSKQSDAWLVLNIDRNKEPYAVPVFADSVAAFNGAIVESENYTLYYITHQ